MKNKINYVSPKNGGLWFVLETSNNENKYVDYVVGKDLDECALIIATYGLADKVQRGFDMKFASKYGFDTDDCAENLYQNAIKLSKG